MNGLSAPPPLLSFQQIKALPQILDFDLNIWVDYG